MASPSLHLWAAWGGSQPPPASREGENKHSVELLLPGETEGGVRGELSPGRGYLVTGDSFLV